MPCRTALHPIQQRMMQIYPNVTGAEDGEPWESHTKTGRESQGTRPLGSGRVKLWRLGDENRDGILGTGTEGKRDSWREREDTEAQAAPTLVPFLPLTDRLPRPSLVALSTPVGAPGDTVSLRCAGRVRNMSFVLYRVGEAAPLQYLEATQPWADFQLPRARAPGTYTCYYHTLAAPYVLSERSEPLVISLDGKRPPTQPPNPLDPGFRARPLPL